MEKYILLFKTENAIRTQVLFVYSDEDFIILRDKYKKIWGRSFQGFYRCADIDNLSTDRNQIN